MTIQVRELVPQDAESLRAIRLETLLHYGELFANLHHEEQSQSPAYWRDLATERLDRCFFGLFEKGAMIGVNAARLWEENPKKALGWGNFIRPAYRGRGLAKLLYGKRLEWVKEGNLDGLMVYILDGNTRPLKLLSQQGAKLIFQRKMSFSGGPERLFHWYEVPTVRQSPNIRDGDSVARAG